MPRFKLAGKVTVSVYTEVEADTLELAIAKATKRAVVLGGPGSAAYPDESWVIDEADGSPFDIKKD